MGFAIREAGGKRAMKMRDPDPTYPCAPAVAAFAAGALLGRLLAKRRYSFRGKVVLIAGGSRGLGLLLARRNNEIKEGQVVT
jgi:hypothetical protein